MARRRPESTAYNIAAVRKLRGGVQRRIAPRDPGVIVGNYLMPEYNGQRVSITAAAEVMMSPTVIRRRKGIIQSWQTESWELRDEIGEFRFAGDRIARSVSRMRLYVGRIEPGSKEPVEVTSGPAHDLGYGMFGDIGAMQQALKRGAQHLGFNGESYLVVSQRPDGSHEVTPRSTSELSPAGNTWRLNDGVESRDLDPDTELVIRCWTPHPRFWAYADSSARAVLPVARELKGLTQRIGAEIDSRLAGAGLLLVPESIEVLRGQSTTDDNAGDEGAEDIDPFVRDLMETMIVPLTDRGSAASLVPLVAKVPDESVDKIKHLTFSTPLDKETQGYQDAAIRRIALGMDSPPETLLGLGEGSNHWSAWAVSEEDVAIAVSPVAATLCHALTVGWLRPALDQLGVPDSDTYMVWFDASALELRADRSKDAAALHDKDALSDEALRRENGFDDDDAPTDDELQRRLLTRLVLADPNLAPVILPKLGITDLDWSKALRSSTPTPTGPDTNPPGADAVPPEGDLGSRGLPQAPDSTAPELDPRPAPELTA